MKARYIFPDKPWILVDVLEKVGDLYKVYPVEWIDVERREFYVTEDQLEFIEIDRM